VETNVDPNSKDVVDMEVDLYGLVKKTPWILESALGANVNPLVTAVLIFRWWDVLSWSRWKRLVFSCLWFQTTYASLLVDSSNYV